MSPLQLHNSIDALICVLYLFTRCCYSMCSTNPCAHSKAWVTLYAFYHTDVPKLLLSVYDHDACIGFTPQSPLLLSTLWSPQSLVHIVLHSVCGTQQFPLLLSIHQTRCNCCSTSPVIKVHPRICAVYFPTQQSCQKCNPVSQGGLPL